MSSRTVPRFALSGLLVAALAAPAAAQEGGFQPPLNAEPTIPIPLPKALPSAPMPRAKIQISSLGAVALDLGMPVRTPNDNRQAFNFSIGLFGTVPPTPQPVPMLPPVVMAPTAPIAVVNTSEEELQRLMEKVEKLKKQLEENHTRPMQQPALPEVNRCCPSAPFAYEGRTICVPQPGAFVIGAQGLQRVMPMPEPPRFLVAPTPVPTGSFVISGPGCCTLRPTPCGTGFVKHAQVGCCLTGASGTGCPSGTQIVSINGHVHTVTSAAREVCPSCSNSAANGLSGTWYRDMGVALIAVTFAGDEMTVRMSQGEDNKVITLVLTAHYTVAKDGLVYGTVTSADVDVKGDPDLGMELAEMSLMMQELADAPFSFRTKSTSAGLMVSQLKVASFEGIGSKELMILGGLYKCAKDGKVPEFKPIRTSSRGGRADCGPPVSNVLVPAPAPGVLIGSTVGVATGALIGASCDKAAPVERIGIDFTVPVPTMGQPVPPGSIPLAPGPIPSSARPVSCAPQPDAMKQMVGDVLWEVTNGRAPCAAPCMPPGIPQSARPISCNEPADAMKQMAAAAFFQMVQVKEAPRGGMTLPTPRYLEHYPQYFPPSPEFPLPRELAAQEDPEGAARRSGRTVANGLPGSPTLPAPAKPCAIGTWVRDVGPKRCVVKLAPDHFTVTVSEAHEADGKIATGHFIITADYHLMRDGITAVGLVTSVDVKVDGEVPEDDAGQILQHLGELQKLLEDKPIALTLRMYNDALVIGNVRMQTIGERMDAEPAACIGGRYKAVGDKPLPALKAVKASEPRPMPMPTFIPPPPLPAGAYGYPVLPPATICPPPVLLPGSYGPPALPPGAFGPGFACPAPGPALVPVPLGAPVGDLLPPQNLSRPPMLAPKPVATLPPIPTVDVVPPMPAVQVIQAVTVPEPVPSMSAPTAPTPTMPQPVAPRVSVDAPKAIQATEVAVAWQNKLAALPDPTKNGAPGNGIAGQLLLYGGPKMEFARANGTLTVELVDETPRPAGQRGATPERWVFDKDTLNKLIAEHETFGKSYTLFLPWSGNHSDVTKVKLTVRYDPDSGHTLYAAPTTVTFEPAKGAATTPTMPQPVAPGEIVAAKVGAKQEYSSDPNIRMQQLLYESEDLRQIQNEWRRFWFPDKPNHLTPERIHGGIY